MTTREANAHAKDIRRGLQKTLDDKRAATIGEIAERAKAQPAACREELAQISEKTGAAVWQAKLALQTARLGLKGATLDRKTQLAQKRANCRAEGEHIRGELDSAKAEAAEYKRLERSKPPKVEAKRATRGERASEELQAVEVNLPANLVPYWRKVGRNFLSRFKSDPRKQRASATEAFLEHVAESSEAEAAPVRTAKPTRAQLDAEREERCRIARKEAQKAVAEGKADPRQLNWLRKFCGATGKQAQSAEVPF